IVEAVLQQVLAQRSDVAETQARLREDLALEREVPLPRLRHFQIGIGGGQIDARRGWLAGREYEAVRSGRVGQVQRSEVDARRIRRVVADARADLGKDRL